MSLERDNSGPVPRRVTIHNNKEVLSLWPYTIVLFIHIACYSIILVSVPSLLLFLYNGDSAAAALFFGYLNGGTAFIWIFTRPIYGHLADYYGRRPFVFVFLLGLVASMAGIVMGQNFVSLIAAAAIRGFTDCSVPVIPSVIGDILGENDLMGRRFGQLGAAMGLGAIIGPAISVGITYLSDDRRLPFIVAVALGTVNGVIALIWVKETNEHIGSRKSPWTRRQNSARSLGELSTRMNPFKVFKIFRESTFSFLIALALMFINLSFEGLLTVLFLFTNYKYGWTERKNGILLFLFGLVASVVQVTLLPLVLPKNRCGEKLTAYIGSASYIIGLVLLGLAWVDWWTYVIVVISSWGFIMAPALRGAMSEGTEPNRQGELQGASALLDSIASVGGPFALSACFSFFISSDSPLPQPLPGSPFFLSAVMQVISTLCMIIAWNCCLHSRRTQEQNNREAMQETEDEVDEHNTDPNHPSTPRSNQSQKDELKAQEETTSRSVTPARPKVHGLNELAPPRVAVHPDPDSPGSSRGVSPIPMMMPRVHHDQDPDLQSIHEETLKIHAPRPEEIELSQISLEHKHSTLHHTRAVYDANTYSSSNQYGNRDQDTYDERRYVPTMVHQDDAPDERFQNNYRGGDLMSQRDRYISVRTSSVDETSHSKLKIHLSEDEDGGHYHVNHR